MINALLCFSMCWLPDPHLPAALKVSIALTLHTFVNAILGIATVCSICVSLCLRQWTRTALLLKISFRTRMKRQERSWDGSGLGGHRVGEGSTWRERERQRGWEKEGDF